MPAAQVCPLPDSVFFERAAAMMLKGLTVEYLFHRTISLQAGDTQLFHTAADTFKGSLDCLKPLGMMISFGNASGPVPPFNIGNLGQKGSLKINRPVLFTHTADHDTCQAMAQHLFAKLAKRDITIRISQRFPLEQVAHAQRALEARKTTGSTVLEV